MAGTVMGIVLPIVQQIEGYLVAPIGRQFGYLFCYNSNITNLTDQLEDLKNMRAKVKRNLEVIGGEADAWLTNVEEINKEVEEVLVEGSTTSRVERRGYCCRNVKHRYLLSRKATKKTQIVLALQGKGKKYTKFSYAAAPSKAFKSWNSIFKDVIEALKDNKISIIGICGIEGVGKTTLVEDVAAKLKADHLFDEVTFAVVSQTPNMIKIQDQLEDVLGLKFLEHTSINFVSLKKLCMFECVEVEYLVDISAPAGTRSSVAPDPAAFVNLEELKLSCMYNLIEMCSGGNLPTGSFGRLQRLELEDAPVMRHLWRGVNIQPPCLGNLRVVQLVCCNAIKTLFPESIVKCLVQLQEIKIESCEMVEEIVSREEKRCLGDKRNIIVEFQKLNSLDLQELPNFRCFYPQSSVRSSNHSSIEPIFNPQVILSGMEILRFDGMNNLVQIVGGQMNKPSVIKVDHCERLLQNLKKLVVNRCNSLEAVFDFEGLQVKGEHAKVALGQLKKLELYNLPRLVNIWRMVSKGIKGFRMLRTLKVSSCGSLRYLLSSSTAKLLVNLTDLEIGYCKTIEKVIEAEETNSFENEMVDKIVFPRLQNIELQNLENLAMFCSQNHDFEFLALEKVRIERCPKMRIFCSGSLSTPTDVRVIERHNDQLVLTSDLNNTILKLKSIRDGPATLP